MIKPPSFEQERKLHAQGYHLIAGIDEVGRGTIAGPVAAAAVILHHQINAPWLKLVRDSKQLSPRRREHFFELMQETGLAIGVGVVSQTEIDDIGEDEETFLFDYFNSLSKEDFIKLLNAVEAYKAEK